MSSCVYMYNMFTTRITHSTALDLGEEDEEKEDKKKKKMMMTGMDDLEISIVTAIFQWMDDEDMKMFFLHLVRYILWDLRYYIYSFDIFLDIFFSLLVFISSSSIVFQLIWWLFLLVFYYLMTRLGFTRIYVLSKHYLRTLKANGRPGVTFWNGGDDAALDNIYGERYGT
ncbi:hypothetical protein ACJX0J_021833, partial [Zea mays]